jgi:hypothetical protein
MKRKLAVVGSRTITNYEFVKKLLDKQKENISLIVSGGAKGVDTLAERWAKENGIPTKIFLPDWDTYGSKAGYMRNVFIINECDICLAIWDGKSRGTIHSVNLCKKDKKPYILVDFSK